MPGRPVRDGFCGYRDCLYWETFGSGKKPDVAIDSAGVVKYSRCWASDRATTRSKMRVADKLAVRSELDMIAAEEDADIQEYLKAREDWRAGREIDRAWQDYYDQMDDLYYPEERWADMEGFE